MRFIECSFGISCEAMKPEHENLAQPLCEIQTKDINEITTAKSAVH